MGTDLRLHHADWAMELGQLRCVDLTGPPSAALRSNTKFSPTDLRGDYAVGDSANTYLDAQ